MKRKKGHIFLTFRSGDLNPRFSVIFPPMIWIFMWSEEPEIKSKQASKRERTLCRVSVQGVKSLGGHFACLCREFDFYEVKKETFNIFQKENGNTFTLLIIFIVKSLQKEQNSTNLLLWPPICRNKHAITPKWFNYLDTNSNNDT